MLIQRCVFTSHIFGHRSFWNVCDHKTQDVAPFDFVEREGDGLGPHQPIQSKRCRMLENRTAAFNALAEDARCGECFHRIESGAIQRDSLLKPSWPVGRAVTAIDHEIGKVVADHLTNRVIRLDVIHQPADAPGQGSDCSPFVCLWRFLSGDEGERASDVHIGLPARVGLDAAGVDSRIGMATADQVCWGARAM